MLIDVHINQAFHQFWPVLQICCSTAHAPKMFQLSKIAAFLLVSLALPQNLLAQCDVCQTEVRAACHSETTFSICINGAPSKDYIECPKDYHCTGGKYICYPKSTGEANCVPNNTPRDPDTLCQETQTTNQLTNELDPTCATYIQCASINGVWRGRELKCPSETWFNGKFCTSPKPDLCT
ncbi:uncharacterized protein LOC116804395 [Drosophila mojavensis]|uniref:uncharacterized protein LOC116804395 n=1 Tax=Drosophila mojavensis TaxID=7230 RepID=UPI0013EE47B0|nr:uncharacterized protein LOC116804395 [Drosophila mojavensis]